MTSLALPGQVLGLLHVERTVSTLPAATEFYQEALGFEVIAGPARLDPDWVSLLGSGSGNYVQMRLGAQELRLLEFDLPGKPYPTDRSSADICFQHIAVVTKDIQASYQRLQRYHTKAISRYGPQRLPKRDDNLVAYKFRDPDGHPLELIQFPKAHRSRKPASHARAPGIDHSAIGISNRARSIDFYCHTLGLKLASEQTNQGSDQDHLDNLIGDRVEVVALRPRNRARPHIELLCYLHPLGRSIQISLQAHDRAADRLVLLVDSLAAVLEKLRNARQACFLTEPTETAALISDPDGHLIILTEATDNGNS